MPMIFTHAIGGASHAPVVRLLGLLLGLWLAPAGLAQDRLERLVSEGEQRSSEGEAAQQRIDRVSEETERLLGEYRQATKVLDGLKVYNELLGRQVDGQRDEITALQDSIDRVASIERQIVPLMVRMIDSLDAFVALDVPFLPDERRERVARLRALLDDGGVSVAEKFRKVLRRTRSRTTMGAPSRPIATCSRSVASRARLNCSV